MGDYGKCSIVKWQQYKKLLMNEYPTIGKWDIPIIRKCEVDLTNIKLISADHVRKVADRADVDKSVHFFIEDSKQERFFDHPYDYTLRLAQYANVLTPDYSLYTDMPLAIQVYNVFKSRWCGAMWQDFGLSVIPTVSWSTEESFDFCFDGIEYGSVVAVSTLGALTKKDLFLEGYFEMKKRINPRQVLCFGKTFPEMGDEVIYVSYLETTRREK